MIAPPIDDARRALLIRSHARWRWIFVLLAIVVAGGLHLLLERQARRLDALSDHGKTTTATVTAISRQDAQVYVHYAFVVDGATYTWSVGQKDAPYAIGQPFVVSYLPEAPGLTRPTADLTVGRAEAIGNRSFKRKAVIGIFAFFGVCAALSEWKLRKLRKSQRLASDDMLVSPEWAGRFLAFLMFMVVVSTNFAGDVVEVQRKAFGEAPFGLPVSVVVSLAEVILFAPYVWVMEHVMRLAFQAYRDGSSLSRSGLAVYILDTSRRHPELRRSRTIAFIGLAYFVVLVGGWIAYAASLGI